MSRNTGGNDTAGDGQGRVPLSNAERPRPFRQRQRVLTAAAAAAEQVRATELKPLVRLEIGAALARSVRVIPVLLGGTQMPRAGLSATICAQGQQYPGKG